MDAQTGVPEAQRTLPSVAQMKAAILDNAAYTDGLLDLVSTNGRLDVKAMLKL
jgi:hypothetical protein